MKDTDVLIVVAPRNFRDEEFFETEHLLKAAGYTILIASTQTGPLRGSEGGWINADILIAQAKPELFRAVVFIGGWGAVMLHNDFSAIKLAKKAYEAGLIVGAICVAPVILASAGLLDGKKATCYPTEASKLTAKGAEYTGNLVEVSGRIVTGNGPEAATEFARKLIGLIESRGGHNA